MRTAITSSRSFRSVVASETLSPVAAVKRVNVRSGSGRAISKSNAYFGVTIKTSYLVTNAPGLAIVARPGATRAI